VRAADHPVFSVAAQQRRRPKVVMNVFQEIFVAAAIWFAGCAVLFLVVWSFLAIRNAYMKRTYELIEYGTTRDMVASLRREHREAELIPVGELDYQEPGED
jgi:hypothetical protein